MGISRDFMHNRRATGGKKKAWRKKRKYELERQSANTKLSSNKTIRRIRVRGDNVKWRALRLDTGNYLCNHVKRKLEKRQKDRKLDSHIEEQFGGGKFLACISSHPGQCGRADGYILEGNELEFYMKKL